MSIRRLSRRDRGGVDRKPRLGAGVLALTALATAAIAVGLAMSPAAQGAVVPPSPAELMAMLECDERSLTEDGEVAYTLTDAPIYPDGYQSEETPESLATAFAGEQRLTASAPAATDLYRSTDRAMVALEAADGRVVGVVVAINDGGWKQGGGIACAGG